jgi:hypothetical protein
LYRYQENGLRAKVFGHTLLRDLGPGTLGAAVVDDDLEPLLGEPVEEVGHGAGEGVGERVVLVEDLAGDRVVDDGRVPGDLVAVLTDVEVEERAARLLAGGEVSDLRGEAVAGAEPEPDARGGAFAADQVVAEESAVVGEAFLGGVRSLGHVTDEGDRLAGHDVRPFGGSWGSAAVPTGTP